MREKGRQVVFDDGSGRTRWVRRRGAPAALPMALSLLLPLAAAAARAEPCLVSGVEDAVTLRLDCPPGERWLRLESVRAPRSGPPRRGAADGGGEPYAEESRERVRQWLLGRRVEATAETAWLGAFDVRVTLLASGLALLADPRAARLDPRLAPLAAAERQARASGHGVWSYAVWRRLQGQATAAVVVPPPPALPPPLSLGALAARLPAQSFEERRAAFAAALAQLRPVETAPGGEPSPAAAKPEGRARRARAARPH